jgi:hypothetical protein
MVTVRSYSPFHVSLLHLCLSNIDIFGRVPDQLYDSFVALQFTFV